MVGKEYRIEMLVNGVWVNAREPNGIHCYKSKYEKSAFKIMEHLKEQWGDFLKHSIHTHPNKKIPTDFRIVSRMVNFNRYGVIR